MAKGFAKKHALLCVALAVIVGVVVAEEEERFLITLSPTDPGRWMTMEQVIELSVSGVGFMDKTLHQKRVNPITKLPTPPSIPIRPQQNATVKKLLQSLDVSQLSAFDKQISSFPTRFFVSRGGRAAATFVYDMVNEMKGNRSDVEVAYFSNPWMQPSVIARFNGSVNPDEIVILGSHIDSISFPLTDAPGADDDGSGTSTSLEVFRVLSQQGFRPNRTVEFHFYSAEEVGLKGSQLIAEQYFREAKNVVSMLQLDMLFYRGSMGEDVFGIITDFTNDTLNELIRQCVDEYALIPWQDTSCGYGCSDHASWTEYGYRSAFPFETPFYDINPFIHSPEDTTDKLDYKHGLEFAKVSLAYLVEMAATTYV